jgi:4-hydroxy-tetrahydrodipicolinate reductase
MGRESARAVRSSADMELTGFLDGLATASELEGLAVYRSAADGLAAMNPDVVIDFTNAAWTPVLAEAALEKGVRLVIGTTGLDQAFLERLGRDCARRRLGAVVAPNFALGAVLMVHFARQAAKFFDSAEIIELHHDGKADAPSGTAKATAEGMVAARGRPFVRNVPEREPLPGSRGAELGGVTIHAVRLPGLVAHQEVIFGGTGQTLTIRHDSTGRDSFMPGVLLAVRRVMELDRLVVGLEELLGLAS